MGPVTVRMLENKHKVLEDVLMTAHRKSDIKSEEDLRFYTKNAMARHNLYLESDGFTPHEKLTGQPPFTVTNMIPKVTPRFALSCANLSRAIAHRLSLSAAAFCARNASAAPPSSLRIASSSRFLWRCLRCS